MKKYSVIIHRLDGKPLTPRAKTFRKIGKTHNKPNKSNELTQLIVDYDEKYPGDSPGIYLPIKEAREERPNYWILRSHRDVQYALIYL